MTLHIKDQTPILRRLTLAEEQPRFTGVFEHLEAVDLTQPREYRFMRDLLSTCLSWEAAVSRPGPFDAFDHRRCVQLAMSWLQMKRLYDEYQAWTRTKERQDALCDGVVHWLACGSPFSRQSAVCCVSGSFSMETGHFLG